MTKNCIFLCPYLSFMPRLAKEEATDANAEANHLFNGRGTRLDD